MKVSVRQVFGIDSDLEVPAYSKADEHVPDIDPDYRFDRPTTLAILAGFAKTAASSSPATMAPANPLTSSRLRRGSIGRACGSISTATSAASI